MTIPLLLPGLDVVDTRLLHEAVVAVASKPTSSGVDGVSPADLGTNSEALWATTRRLEKAMKQGTITPMRCVGRQKYPKPAVHDRVVGRYLGLTELSRLSTSPPPIHEIAEDLEWWARIRPDAQLLRLDIADFFGSLRESSILAAFDGGVSPFADAWIRRTREIDAQHYSGLVRGRPESAWLAQRALAEFDDHARSVALYYGRWVDDIVLIPKSAPDLDPEDLIAALEERLPAGLRFSQSEGKRTITRVAGDFLFLGFHFREGRCLLPAGKGAKLIESLNDVQGLPPHPKTRQSPDRMKLQGWLKAHCPARSDLQYQLLLDVVDDEYPHLQDITSLFRITDDRGTGEKTSVQVSQASSSSHTGAGSLRLGTTTIFARSSGADQGAPSASPMPAAPPDLYDPDFLLEHPRRTWVLEDGVLVAALRRAVGEVLAWADVLGQLRRSGVHRALFPGTFGEFCEGYLRIHRGLAARVVRLGAFIEKTANYIGGCFGRDQAALALKIPPEVVWAMLDLRSERRWAWQQREALVQGVLLDLVHPSEALASISRSKERAQRLKRGAGARARWSCPTKAPLVSPSLPRPIRAIVPGLSLDPWMP